LLVLPPTLRESERFPEVTPLGTVKNTRYFPIVAGSSCAFSTDALWPSIVMLRRLTVTAVGDVGAVVPVGIAGLVGPRPTARSESDSPGLLGLVKVT